MKKITKIITIILMMIMLALLLETSVKADDEEETSVTYSMMSIDSENKVSKGEELILKICVGPSEDGLLGLQGTLNIDTDVFEVVDKEVVKENWYLSAYNDETNMFMIEVTDEAFYDDDSYIHDEEEILEVTLKVKEDIDISETNININDIKVVDSNFETLDVDEVNKTIEISSEGSTSTGRGIAVPVIIVIIIVIIVAIILIKKKIKK